MYEVGYWCRPGYIPGKQHVTYKQGDEYKSICPADGMIEPDVEYFQVAKEIVRAQVTCGHCERILDNPVLREKRLGEGV